MSENVLFLGPSVPPQRLSRTIHQHIFGRMSGTQFTDCITYLAHTHFVLVCTHYHVCQFTYYMLLSLEMSAHVSLPCFTHLLSFHPSELPQAQRSNNGPPPKRFGPTILTCTEQPQSPFVCWHTFMCVSLSPTKSTLPSSGFTHKSPQLK